MILCPRMSLHWNSCTHACTSTSATHGQLMQIVFKNGNPWIQMIPLPLLEKELFWMKKAQCAAIGENSMTTKKDVINWHGCCQSSPWTHCLWRSRLEDNTDFTAWSWDSFSSSCQQARQNLFPNHINHHKWFSRSSNHCSECFSSGSFSRRWPEMWFAAFGQHQLWH